MDAQWPLTQPVKRGTCGLLLGDDDARLRVDVGLDRPLLDGRVHFRHRRRSYVSRTSRCGSAGGGRSEPGRARLHGRFMIHVGDVGLFVGHGPSGVNLGYLSGYLWFTTSNTDEKLWPTEVRWGNYDLDWCFCRCALILGIGVIPYNDRLKLMMAGVHEILGYATDMTEYCASGEILADQLIGRSSGTARTYYGPGCANEYLPGYGPYGSEPAPYWSHGEWCGPSGVGGRLSCLVSSQPPGRCPCCR